MLKSHNILKNKIFLVLTVSCKYKQMCKILSKSESVPSVPTLQQLVKKKIWANLQRIIEPFTQKIVIMLSKIFVWDPGSGFPTLKDNNISYSLGN